MSVLDFQYSCSFDNVLSHFHSLLPDARLVRRDNEELEHALRDSHGGRLGSHFADWREASGIEK